VVLILTYYFHSFILYPDLGEDHSPLQNEFSTNFKCDPVFPLSNSSIFIFPSFYPVAAYIFFLVFPFLYIYFYLSFKNILQNAVSTQNVTNPVSFFLFIVCRTFLSSLIHCNSPSFRTRSIKTSFSNLLQRHASKLSRYF
jgi:hypothetical protein